jgi:hypothetical protein
MNGTTADVAVTISEILRDLAGIAGRLPYMTADEALTCAGILDRLSAELSEAAAGLQTLTGTAPGGGPPAA